MAAATGDMTRRGMITGTVAAAAAWIAGAIGRPPTVAAADGDPMLIGELNTADTTTQLSCGSSGFTALRVGSASVGVWAATSSTGNGAVALLGEATGSTGAIYGVQGETHSPDGIGVWAIGGGTGLKAQATDTGVQAYGAKRGVVGYADGDEAVGVYAEAEGTSQSATAVRAYTAAHSGNGVTATAEGDFGTGVEATVTGPHGIGIRAIAQDKDAIALYAQHTTADSTGPAIIGESVGPTAIGILARGGLAGIRGEGATIGVLGTSQDGQAVGIRGEATSANGVEGASEAPGGAGVFGSNIGGGDGVLGTSDGPTAAGVHGANGGGTGVRGETGSGIAVRGTASTGTAGAFEAPSGRAIYARGPIQFDLASGIAPMRAGTKQVTVATAFDLTSESKVLAMLQSSAGGKTSVALVQIDPAANTFTIQLTEKATQDCGIAWLVLG